ncbi:hypothetical protein RM50_04570 [Pseudarthrobacter phenanthrenivorans]|uniref:Uncharacterized protein n=2 Tax=Pseudarthrobacter phenanthrenivorans TaxID=361575 RepID=A0A0B4DPW5_PSEPS|nr:hypothetical protein RM50_04570 [Pseudarthrobacter phenanthrenivorans]
MESPDALDPLTRALIELRVRAVIFGDAKEQLQPYVDAARDAGATWKQVAEVEGLANASSAHSTHGPKKKERNELMRLRQAAARRGGPKEPPPGISAVEAGKILGLDARTVKKKGERGEIRTATIKSASGNDRVFYILD